MNFFLLGDFVNGMLGFLMAFLSIFLIMLILIQRGKGGGLTGALGGPGGQSAFGSKAGDTFTVVTIVVASIWGFICAFAMWMNVPASIDDNDLDVDSTASVESADPGQGTTTPDSGNDALGGGGLSGPGMLEIPGGDSDPGEAGVGSEANSPESGESASTSDENGPEEASSAETPAETPAETQSSPEKTESAADADTTEAPKDAGSDEAAASNDDEKKE